MQADNNCFPHLIEADISLHGDTCRAWYVDTDALAFEDAKACARAQLPAAEYAKGLAKSTANDKIQYWATRLTLRHAFSRYTDHALSADEWTVNRLPSGKPVVDHQLVTDGNLDFSITHTNGITVCAICKGGKIGIDIESINREINPVIFNSRFFSKRELQHLKQSHPERQQSVALQLWNLKEACSKALGRGLAMDFSDIRFSVPQSGSPVLESIELRPDVKRWGLLQQNFLEKYILAVVTGP